MNSIIHSSQHRNVSLLFICWCLGIKIHFWNHKHYQNRWWKSVIMMLFLCCVRSADASEYDDFFRTMKSYAVVVTKGKKRGRVMLSLPAKRVCEFMLLTWHIFLYYAYVSHLLPPLTLKLAFNRQNKPIFHAHSHLVLLPFFAGCCNCL